MSILAAIIDWEREAADGRALGALLSSLPNRSLDGRWFARAPHALLGLGRRWVRKAERAEVQPLKDQTRQVCAVGDLRLDNRDDLRRTLHDGARPLDSDIQLLVAGYHRWGLGLAERLVGDFAFVIWDWRRRQVYAARDPFGVRALVYRSTDTDLVLATDAAQLLALPDTDRTPEDQTVVDLLAWSYAHYGRTLFRAIRSLHPGHYLLARQGSLREVEYLRPPDRPLRYRCAAEYHEQFRWLFRQAVADRLDSEHPIVAHLSGGLDSSSIVCQADRIYREGGAPRPPLVTASALFPSQPHDETPFIDAVAGGVRFESRRWDGNIPSGREFSHPALGLAGSSVFFNGGSAGDLDIAASTGSRVLLSGEAGDFVTGEIGLFNDLLLERRWLTAIRQIEVAGSRKERDTRIGLLRRAIREELPRGLVSLWDLKNPAPGPPPTWLNPGLRPLWTDRRAWPVAPTGARLSRMERGAWTYLRMPRTAWSLDYAGAYAADAGVEIRYPLLDSRLVEFVLAIPFEQRLTGALPRWFHREALRPMLPALVADRASKPGFTGAVIRWGKESLSKIRDTLEGTEWVSGRFVDQTEARRLLQRLSAAPPRPKESWDDWRDLRSIVNIEVWRRTVLGYCSSQEGLPMSEVEENMSGAKDNDEAAPAARIAAYLPPKLISVGNVNQLLASSPPSGADSGGPVAGAND